MKNLLPLFLALFLLCIGDANAQSNQKGNELDTKEAKRSARFVLTINSIEKDGQLDAGKQFSWSLKDIKTIEDRQIVEKLKIVLASYKPSFGDVKYEDNKAIFTIIFGLPIKAAELEKLTRSINVWTKVENPSALVPVIQESKN